MSTLGAEVGRLIDIASEERLRVLSIEIPSGELRSGMFGPKEGDDVVIDLVGLSRNNFQAPGSMCTVVFSRGARTYAFTASVKRIDASGDRPDWARLRVGMPHELHQSERRAHVRVPVHEGLGLEVRLGRERGPSRPALPRDLSLGGVLVNLGGEDLLGVGDAVSVELRLAGRTAVLAGTIRRADPPLYGVAFLGDGLGESADARTLRSILNLLELDWRSRRAP